MCSAKASLQKPISMEYKDINHVSKESCCHSLPLPRSLLFVIPVITVKYSELIVELEQKRTAIQKSEWQSLTTTKKNSQRI